jgi:hypothetical protein
MACFQRGKPSAVNQHQQHVVACDPDNRMKDETFRCAAWDEAKALQRPCRKLYQHLHSLAHGPYVIAMMDIVELSRAGKRLELRAARHEAVVRDALLRELHQPLEQRERSSRPTHPMRLRLVGS